MTAVALPPVPLPTTVAGGDNRAELARAIASWVDSPAMTALLREFRYGPLPDAPLGDRLAALEKISAERWDYRAGNLERHEAVGERFDPAADARIRSAAGALGLADRSTPSGRRYDHVLVLGGGVRTMMARAHLAATILRSGVGAGSVTGLGSLRLLHDQNDLARQLGLGECVTEGDAVDEALRHVFDSPPRADQRIGRTTTGEPWWIRSYPGTQPPLHVLAAPSSRPGERANTADTLIGWAELTGQAPAGARLLLVTTDIFVPFQHCDAVRILGLGYGCGVETVGFANFTDRWVQPAETFAILQEVRSAIRSMRALHHALT
ncbi:hypothetical protein [Micromonospora sp. WMMD1155]|uniref:hypothetical protein n=1 Tax=Micromonospora sp. WMMD1155 TaxID=3016094 RepID=UPI00249C0649|nr:hypothetical protein [Micromonospora sp. WMMD1155]WFE52894.1 hypothetical protein O7617_22395 [Micromonospora sp. WMMD1155]